MYSHARFALHHMVFRASLEVTEIAKKIFLV
jgi:hypothetical protein